MKPGIGAGLVLLALWVSSPAAQAGAQEGAALVVAQARHAVAGDSAGRVAQGWRARFRRDPRDRAAALGLAEIAFLTYAPDAAARYHRACEPSRGDEYCLHARLGLADLAYRAGGISAAVSQFDSAGDAARRSGNRLVQGLAAMRGAYAMATLAGPAAALPGLAAAEPLLPADALAARAELLYRRAVMLAVGAEPAARAVADSAIAMARLAREPALEAAGYNALGLHFQAALQADSALVMFRRAAALYGRARDRYSRAMSLLRAAGVLREFAELGAARSLMLEARADAEASRNPLALSSTSTGLGAIALQLGDYTGAIADLGRARKLFAAARDTASLALVDYFEGLARAGAGDLAGGRQLLLRSAGHFRGYGDLENYMLSLRAVLFVLTRQQDWGAAERVLAQARALARAQHQPQWLRRLRYDEGRLALVRGDLREAERLLGDYAATVDSAEHLRRHDTGVQLAEVYARRGELARAEATIAQAGLDLDRWRATLPERDLRVYAFQAHSNDTDDHGASRARVLHALALGGRTAAAFELAERSRARELGDALARAAAARTGASEQPQERGNAAPAPVPSAASVMAALPDAHTAVLEYVAGQAGAPTTVFVLSRSGLAAAAVPPADSLAPAIARLNGLIESGSAPRGLARSLGARILDPALALLPHGITRLIVVPDGPLHRVPFDALRTADGRYVLERYALSTSPSAAVLLALMQSRSANGRAPGYARLLVFGDPVFAPDGAAPNAARGSASPAGAAYRDALDGASGLPRLPESGREARLVARYAPGAEVRLRDAASVAFLKSAPLERFGVIHFATHAVVDERSAARTALALTPGGGESGFVGPGDLAALRLRADLVVLSACRTAGGVLIGGEGVAGLTSPLLEAGALAVVASSWRVGDRQTVKLVRGFYDALARGQPVGEALRSAKLRALRRGATPAEWAAFGVIGDPLARVSLRSPPARPGWVLAAALALALLAALRYRPRSRSDRLEERVSEPSAPVALTHQR